MAASSRLLPGDFFSSFVAVAAATGFDDELLLVLFRELPLWDVDLPASATAAAGAFLAASFSATFACSIAFLASASAMRAFAASDAALASAVRAAISAA